MNANDMLDIIGEARGSFIMEAQAHRERKPMHRRRSPARILLIAAAVAVLLAGCTYAVLKLQDMKADERPYTKQFNDQGRRADPTEVTIELYTPHAMKDTPYQKATMEWNDFLSEYDPDHPQVREEDIPEKFKYAIPANYMDTYRCSTPEMAMKLDEITAKYNLKLLDMELLAQRWQRGVMNELMGISGVTLPDAPAKVEEVYGTFYPNGNFISVLHFTLWQEDVVWTEQCSAEFHYAKKDTFAPQLSTTFAGEYEQWNYTSADGTPLLLVLKDSGEGQIYADAGDATIFIDLNPWTPFDEDEKPTKEAIQQMADIFDYHLKPQAYDPLEAHEKLKAVDEEYQKKLGSTESRSYADFLNKMDWLGRYTYALKDLNGDGVDELILDNSGVICNFYTIENGEVAMRGGLAFEPYAFYEGNYVISESDEENLGGKYHAFRVRQYTGTGHTSFKSIENLYRREDGTWEHKIGDDYEGTIISDDEAQAIMSKYTPTDLGFTPVTNFPMDASGITLGELMAAEPKPSNEDAYRLFAEFAAGDDSRLRNARYFALRDMNGDGLNELLLSAEPDSIDYIMSIYRGRVAELRRNQMVLCEGNVLDGVQRWYHNEFESEFESHNFQRIYDEHRGKELGYVVHNLTADTWEDKKGNPVSAEDALALLAKYPPMDPGMKPISELK